MQFQACDKERCSGRFHSPPPQDKSGSQMSNSVVNSTDNSVQQSSERFKAKAHCPPIRKLANSSLDYHGSLEINTDRNLFNAYRKASTFDVKREGIPTKSGDKELKTLRSRISHILVFLRFLRWRLEDGIHKEAILFSLTWKVPSILMTFMTRKPGAAAPLAVKAPPRQSMQRSDRNFPFELLDLKRRRSLDLYG
ncbi:hypothetical protein NPIL_502481 [Nephila pilipes]|uniref:Uncharacterized protein n=1 Tax=Nephila pilipes TaxID=299642 RepID=A0A8X6TVE9_NEPPI|nr:hypothetical protein NPIL_502481 [Nephila pilipes]